MQYGTVLKKVRRKIQNRSTYVRCQYSNVAGGASVLLLLLLLLPGKQYYYTTIRYCCTVLDCTKVPTFPKERSKKKQSYLLLWVGENKNIIREGRASMLLDAPFKCTIENMLY